MNLYKISTIGLLTGIVVACGAAGTDATPVARADDGTAGAAPDCMCTGQPGPQGLPGPSGPAGLQGPAGKDAVCANDMNSCPPGVPGPQGPTGAVGPAGPQGPKGDPGLNGSDGMTGPAGASGPAGAKGENGDAGSVGPAGPKGDTGEAGPEGPAGLGLDRSQIYKTEYLAASGTVATAACLRSQDILISGGCSALSAALNTSMPSYHPTLPEGGVDSWGCSTQSSGQIYAVAYCLSVP